jgi:hypothetical protein
MEPMDPEVAYTVNANVKMMAKRTVVCVLRTTSWVRVYIYK